MMASGLKRDSERDLERDYSRPRSPHRRDRDVERHQRTRTKYVERARESGVEDRDKGSDKQRKKKRNEETEVSKDGGDKDVDEDDEKLEERGINFGLSGKLAAESNTFKGVCIKYSEPVEARIPKVKWRLYEFKGDESKSTLYVHRQSAYLIGRDRKVVDFPVDHPSCSKQHAVLQYRLVDYDKGDGRRGKKVKPYIIDLESTNGTFINNQKIEPSRYVEIKEKDTIKFGFSTRDYVLLHENSNDDDDLEAKTD